MNEDEHKAYHRRLIYVFLLLLLVLFAGAFFYHYIEKWSYVDALYFSAATMTTVGYGDIIPKSDISKLFTIIYMFSGVGIALYGLSLLASHFVEVREEFWLRNIGKIRIGQRTTKLRDRLRRLFNYNRDEIIGYDKPVRKRK